MYFIGPALPAVKWELRTFENSLETANPYKGAPSPELDDAWNKLLAPSAVRVSKEDLVRINRTSIPIKDGNGYFGTLGKIFRPEQLRLANTFVDVHHQLHCLRWVRQALNPAYYSKVDNGEHNSGQHIGNYQSHCKSTC